MEQTYRRTLTNYYIDLMFGIADFEAIEVRGRLRLNFEIETSKFVTNS